MEQNAASRIPAGLRGQLFLFDAPTLPALSSTQRWRLAAIFLTLEFLVRPLLRLAAHALGSATKPWVALLQMVLVTAAACLLILTFAKVPFSQLGLRSWSRCTRIEKLYFIEIVPFTLAIFVIAQFTTIKFLVVRPVTHLLVTVLIQQMLWGFYQELLYRGIVQTELVRRLGAVWGILASNLVFTFGPLHFYHFALSRNDPTHLWIFAGIFAIGLYFALLYHRSRNLWMIAILHGIGDFFIDGLNQIVRILH
jgi:uncharacterized protein